METPSGDERNRTEKPESGSWRRSDGVRGTRYVKPERNHGPVIGRDEVRETASSLGITESNVQRDYIFGWLLAATYSESGLSEPVALRGEMPSAKPIPQTPGLRRTSTSRPRVIVDPDRLIDELDTACRKSESRVHPPIIENFDVSPATTPSSIPS